MDLEHLNKTQIILLTLLVSFVTSIATGIVTVTLIDQAPRSVTQTINRIVERTVEKVAPNITGTQGAAAKEVTIVVKEEDLITDSIVKNAKTSMRIVAQPVGLPDVPADVVGAAVSVSPTLAATARSIFAEGFLYSVLDARGNSVSFKLLDSGAENPVVIMELSSKDMATATPAILRDSASVKLGQTVIGLSGTGRQSIAVGVVAGLDTTGEAASTTLTTIETSINTYDTLPGSQLINIFGETIGIRSVALGGNATYIPSSFILGALRAVSSPATHN